MKITLPKERPISLNKFYAGIHWAKRKAEADRVHWLLYHLTKSAIKNPYQTKVNILITAYFDKRPLDSDNIFSKLYVDGLKGEIIVDDTPEYVGTVSSRSEIDKENPRVEIEIEPEEGEIPAYEKLFEYKR